MIAALLLLGQFEWIIDEPDRAEPVAAPTPYAAAYARSKADRVPLVVLVSASWCKPCQTMKRELAGWTARTDIAFVVVDYKSPAGAALYRGAVPEVFGWKIAGAPNGGVVSGYASPGKLTRALGLPGGSSRVTVQVRPSVQARPVRGTIRGQWTWPGVPSASALERHLSEPPHNYDRSYLSGLSDSQLVTLHDAWHNRNGARGVNRSSSQRRWFRRGSS